MHISLGHKKQSERHIERFEDALTSAFFGTLRYLPTRIVVDLFISLLSKDGLVTEELTKFGTDDVIVKMNFWPNVANQGRVEPDLMISLSHGHSKLDLLIECKWKSSESSDCQLLGQWGAVTQTDRVNTYHIYLVKDLLEGNRVRENNIKKASEPKVWNDRLFVISWLNILKSLLVLSVTGVDKHSAIAVMQWKEDMAAMFGRIGINEFGGFKLIAEPINATEGKVFWSSPFHGFQQFMNDDVGTDYGVYFFNKIKN